ncbi:hypothetical protein D3C85_1525890 [compost metagenome]
MTASIEPSGKGSSLESDKATTFLVRLTASQKRVSSFLSNVHLATIFRKEYSNAPSLASPAFSGVIQVGFELLLIIANCLAALTRQSKKNDAKGGGV